MWQLRRRNGGWVSLGWGKKWGRKKRNRREKEKEIWETEGKGSINIHRLPVLPKYFITSSCLMLRRLTREPPNSGTHMHTPKHTLIKMDLCTDAITKPKWQIHMQVNTNTHTRTHTKKNLQPQSHSHWTYMDTWRPTNAQKGNIHNIYVHNRGQTIKIYMDTSSSYHLPNIRKCGYVVAHNVQMCFYKTNTHAHMYTIQCTSIIICVSHLLIYLLAYLFICVFILHWVGFLFMCCVPRGVQENIHLLMRAVINSEQAHPSFFSTVSLSLFSLSIRRAHTLSLPISPFYLLLFSAQLFLFFSLLLACICIGSHSSD